MLVGPKRVDRTVDSTTRCNADADRAPPIAAAPTVTAAAVAALLAVDIFALFCSDVYFFFQRVQN